MTDQSIRFDLPRPPSTNNLFPTQRSSYRRYVGKEYRQWRGDAGRLFLAQGGAPRIKGPVNVKIIIQDEGTGDLDNRLKAVLDFCVHHQIIEDDSRKIVRAISLAWSETKEGCTIEIERAA